MQQPLVSILIPAFNAEKWIANTICSALSQTWERKEVIVVDDGSTDRTPNILREFRAKGVHVVTQANRGGSAARNAALSLCSGDYIQWLDADDLIASNKIALQIQELTRTGSTRTLASAAWAHFSHRWYGARFHPTELWCDLSPSQWLSRKMGLNLYMPPHCWLVSRELSDAAGCWNTTLSIDDDGEYFCRVLLQADRVQFITEAKVYYRVSGAGTVSNVGFSDRKLNDQWRSVQAHMGYLRSLEDSVATRAACVAFMQTWLPYFYPQRPDIVTQAQELAKELGGQLETPKLRRKYVWIGALLGRRFGRRAEVLLPRARSWFTRSLDWVLLCIGGRKYPALP